MEFKHYQKVLIEFVPHQRHDQIYTAYIYS